MVTKKTKSDLDSLETFRLALTNVKDQPDLAQYMSEIGYNEEVLEEGRKIYEKSMQSFAQTKKERSDRNRAYKAFYAKWNKLLDLYTLHRDKSRVVFRKEEETIENLLLNRTLPTRYIIAIDRIKDFYTQISADESLKTAIARLNVSADEIAEGLSLISEVEALRAKYVKEKAEAQNATDIKRAVLREADDWMKDFLDVAKIAVREFPQLQEAFGKIIKN